MRVSELFAIAQGPLPTTQYETLTDEQKAGILDVVGNSTRVKRFCPFKVGQRGWSHRLGERQQADTDSEV